ncbi:Pancreatic triacylglycerol lipase [Halotydeus destructor]|nr:Pancreatic triacylglycerol lipase [Halotydeus destructor]
MREVRKLVDACLVSMYLETPTRDNASVTKMTPDKDQHTGYPEATIPPADFTQYHPLYGSMTGYEEPNYHLGLLPQDPITLDTRLVFPDSKFAKVVDVAALNSTDMVPVIRKRNLHTRNFIVSHDFDDNYQTDDTLKMLVTFLIRYRAKLGGTNSVVLVDSKTGSKAGLNGTFYKQAAANAILIGRQVGAFIFQLTEAGVDRSKIHLIGYGLGAQILHFAARWFTRLHLERNKPEGYLARVGRLTGLDPIGAHFEGFRPLFGESPHILVTDAQRVDVITTSGGSKGGLAKDPLEGHYGMSQTTWAHHFFPNGGHDQPTCDNEINSPVVGYVGMQKVSTLCSHKRALLYFMHSLRSKADRKQLTASKTADWEEYVRLVKANIKPPPSVSAIMGIQAFDHGKASRGHFYLSNSIDDAHQIHAIAIEDQPKKKEHSRAEYRSLQVPPRFDSEEIFSTYPIQAVPNAVMNLKDPPSCGKFRSSPSGGRVFRGQLPYTGQFPWVVCIITRARKKWQQSCTGAILNDKFILTAAHCFDDAEEGDSFYITYGTSECLKPAQGMFKKVIFGTNNTVFIMPKYQPSEIYDVSLIRLVDPIAGLPVERYSGELVNSICFHANQQYDDNDMKTYSYVAGFGMKGVGRLHDNANLTWTYEYRKPDEVTPEYSDIFSVSKKNSPFDFYYNDRMYTTCGGDSGGSYAWYVNTQDGHVDGISDYRAVAVSIVKSGLETCDFRYYNDFTTLGIASDISMNMRHRDTFSFVVSKMAEYHSVEAPSESAKSRSWDPPEFTLE